MAIKYELVNSHSIQIYMFLKISNVMLLLFKCLYLHLILMVVLIQVLPPDFNDFLWNCDFDYLYLYNSNGGMVRTDIEYQSCDSLNTKLKNGWEEFCTSSGYQAGDVLRFKFFDGKMSNFVHVYTINA
jgi:hypothetical protein